jgi:hypothetical protein
MRFEILGRSPLALHFLDYGSFTCGIGRMGKRFLFTVVAILALSPTLNAQATSQPDEVQELRHIIAVLQKPIAQLKKENADLKTKLLSAVANNPSTNPSNAPAQTTTYEDRARKYDPSSLEFAKIVDDRITSF